MCDIQLVKGLLPKKFTYLILKDAAQMWSYHMFCLDNKERRKEHELEIRTTQGQIPAQFFYLCERK